MDLLRTDARTWDFSRCPLTGQVMLWPRETCPARWVGRLEEGVGKAGRPAMVVSANPLNQGVSMLRIARSYRRWAEGRPVAVAGEIAAGRFDVTVAYCDSPEAQEVLLLPPEEIPPDCFALRVRGSSMQEAGIQDGDYVLVRPQCSADNGDLVVAAMADAGDPAGYVTLKQFFLEGDHVRLQPANASIAPIHLCPQRGRDPVQIEGKVVAVVRLDEEQDD